MTKKADPLLDSALSLKAKGAYIYLKKYANKKTSAREMTRLHRDGRDGVLAAFKELEDRGYLRRQKHANGSITNHLLWNMKKARL